MQKGTQKILGTLGVIGAGSLLLHEITKDKAPSTEPETKTALGFTGEADLTLVIKETIKNDKELQRSLKGLDGTSMRGEQGRHSKAIQAKQDWYGKEHIIVPQPMPSTMGLRQTVQAIVVKRLTPTNL